MTYSIHKGREAFERVLPAWDALESKCPGHVFQTTGFARSWIDTIGENAKAMPLIVAYGSGNGVVGIFPACVVRERAVPLITWLGGPHILDYGDILFDQKSCDVTAEQFVRESLTLLHDHARGAFLYLPNVRNDALSSGALHATLRQCKKNVAPYIRLEGTYDDFAASLGKKKRHNLATFEHRLDRLGETQFRVLPHTDPEFEATLGKLFRLQTSRFASRPSSAPILDSCYQAFRLEHARCEGGPVAATLTVEGHLIASSLQSVHQDTMYYLMAAFDPDFAHVAPGKLLIRRLVQYCFEAGLHTFDFCMGGEPYKFFWTHDEEPLATFVANNATGHFLAAAVSLKRLFTSLLAAMPTPH